MLHTVIIDDEINGLKSLEFLVREYSDVKLVGSTTDALKAADLINNYRPDVVFMDINMPELNGFEVLERLQFKKFHLVFTTAYAKFALLALKQNATDYLLKPVDRKELAVTLNNIRQKIADQQSKPDVYQLLRQVMEARHIKVLLPTKKSLEYVMPHEIVCIEADSNYARVFLCSGQSVQVTSALKDFEQQLCGKELSFIRVHHSHIINIDYVTRYIKDDGGFAVLQGRKTIPISRSKKEEFLRAINFLG